MKILPWLTAAILLYIMVIGTTEISKVLGITTTIYYDEPITVSNRYYEEEVYSDLTGFGLFFGFLSFAVAFRGYMAVDTGTLNGGVSPLGNIQLLIILVSLFAHAIIEQIIVFILDIPDLLDFWLSLGCMLGIGYFAYKFYKKKEDKFYLDNEK
jgi:hypothetical protein